MLSKCEHNPTNDIINKQIAILNANKIALYIGININNIAVPKRNVNIILNTITLTNKEIKVFLLILSILLLIISKFLFNFLNKYFICIN